MNNKNTHKGQAEAEAAHLASASAILVRRIKGRIQWRKK